MGKTKICKWYKHFQENHENNLTIMNVLNALAPREPMTSPDHNQKSRCWDIIGSCHQICDEKIQSFCTMTRHLLTYHCLFVNFLPKTLMPDMAPCGFFLLPKLKRTMEGQYFEIIDGIKTELLNELKAIPKSEFQKGFEVITWKGTILMTYKFFFFFW